MSDLHLVPEGGLSHSIDTYTRLTCAIDYLNLHHADAEFCILNGDLADHGEALAYQRLKSALAELKMPAYFTLGNHDDSAAFASVFGNDLAVFDHNIETQQHHVVVLNSQDPGKVTGILSQRQIDWFDAEMDKAAGRPVVIVLHHPIADQGTGTDFLRLQNPEPLIARAKAHGDVRQIISGHVHTTTSGMIQGLPVATLAGNHYNFSPFSAPEISDMGRTEGPGEVAVILSDETSTIVHFDKFWDRNALMDPSLFVYKGPKA